MIFFLSLLKQGELAQLAARVLSMHKVAGSIPAFSIIFVLDIDIRFRR
jgi:hypothetical protein